MPGNYLKFRTEIVQKYLDHYPSPDICKEHGLPYLRDKLFISILLITFPICCVAYIPSIVISLLTHQWIIGFFDTLCMLALVFILLGKNYRIQLKKTLFSAIFYTLSIILFIYMGMQGPAVIILLCISVLITLFHSKRAGLISVALNLIIFLLILPFFTIKASNEIFFQKYTIESLMVVCFNLIAFNTLVVLSAASLVDQLNESFLEEKKLQELLRKESVELLLAKQRAEESDRLKSAFLTNMSHEIRTPMNGILGFTDLLSEPQLDDRDQQKYLGIVKKSAARMFNLINEIVEIAKIESGQTEVVYKEINLQDQIDHIFYLLKPEADRKNLYLSIAIGIQVPGAFIRTDGEKLYAILTNLVKNAIKYTEKGSIQFGYNLRSAVSSELTSQPAEIVFFVKDTGIGIPANRQKAIFDRFVQADIEDTEARQGAGLGLSIAKSYVEMLNGRIWVESEPGKGSMFYFTLPYLGELKETPTANNLEIPEGHESWLKDHTVLIVEDDETSSVFISAIARKFSRKIFEVQSGIEAIKVFRSNPDIDLILMDIRMSGMSGYEATRQIRQFNKDVFIIAQTAHAMIGDKEKALEAGCDGYITKPISNKKLQELIRNHWNKK